MEKINETLWKDYKEANIILGSMRIGSDGYKETLEMKDKIRNELLKLKQLEEENKREKIRNWITIGTFGINFVGGLWMVHKTFKFDETATVTSTLGRNILNGALPKMFKKQ